MTKFPDNLGEWLSPNVDGGAYQPATPQAVAAFVAEGWDVPESVQDLSLRFGSAYFDGDRDTEQTRVVVLVG